jgi:succinate dehydrogenase hydrophobic anchor subunit
VRPRLRIVLWSLAFWAIWIGIAGLAMTIHGDCGIGTTEAEIAACVREKGWVGIVATAIGVVVYGILIWRITRRYRRTDA